MFPATPFPSTSYTHFNKITLNCLRNEERNVVSSKQKRLSAAYHRFFFGQETQKNDSFDLTRNEY